MRSPEYTRLAGQLPALYHDDPLSFAQVDGYLGLVDELNHAVLQRSEDLLLSLGPDALLRWPDNVPLDAGEARLVAAYRDVYDLLATWTVFDYPLSWPGDEPGLGKRRAYVSKAARLWRRRGTPRGFLDWLCFSFDVADTARPLLVEHFKAPGASLSGEPFTATLFVPSTAQFGDYRRRQELAEFVDEYAPAHVWIRTCYVATTLFATLGVLTSPPTLPTDPTGDQLKKYADAVVTHQKDLNALLCSVVSVVSHEGAVHIYECIDEGRPVDRLDVGELPTDPEN